MAARPWAYFDGLLATDLVDSVDLQKNPQALERGGWWAVAATFEGELRAYRFARVAPGPLPAASGTWSGIPSASWRSSLDRTAYLAGVRAIRENIRSGDVYQVNLCRVLSAELPPADHADPAALAAILADGNPAPYQGTIFNGAEWVVTASPELYLSRNGDAITSAPIKGTAPTPDTFAYKDIAENIMITDLVRNDLNRICTPTSVRVQTLLETQSHPGLAHLVSTVAGTLRGGVGWADIFTATFPPGSVTGAPKIRALQVISDLEPVPRGPYCGAVGYVDADNHTAELAVGIRSFFSTTDDAGRRRINFGTGAGITFPSDPLAEWEETELKAARLMALVQPPQEPRSSG
ncbi:anthranilate synthase component I family protein [Nakamurella antarctica]|uniref:Anthranilate synthase component I family protein n=1 Tax=Nakamurella antarctica TaxID=1902245 RepID=A0A3G8ZUC6_9ACTN|nr:anthranilate synthase component I family protein [Nakamurella antarctica]AZI57626.1 anthranilate synthase component I family protein [Nakamurella antarctica]